MPLHRTVNMTTTTRKPTAAGAIPLALQAITITTRQLQALLLLFLVCLWVCFHRLFFTMWWLLGIAFAVLAILEACC